MVKRRNPVRLIRSSLTGSVYAVTDYVDLGEGRIRARQKHDVTEDFDSIVMNLGLVVERDRLRVALWELVESVLSDSSPPEATQRHVEALAHARAALEGEPHKEVRT